MGEFHGQQILHTLDSDTVEVKDISKQFTDDLAIFLIKFDGLLNELGSFFEKLRYGGGLLLIISIVDGKNDGLCFILFAVDSFVDLPEITNFFHHLWLIVLVVR